MKPAALGEPAAPPPGPRAASPGGGEDKAPGRAVTTTWVGVVLASLAAIVLTGLTWNVLSASDAVSNVGGASGAIAYAALGALIVRRTGNLVGWFMLAEGVGNAIMAAGSAYAVFGVTVHPGTLPAPAVVGALAESSFVIVSTGLAAIFLVFPSGRLPSPRWRARGGWPGADRPDAGGVRGQRTAGGPTRPGRQLADLSEPARGPVT